MLRQLSLVDLQSAIQNKIEEKTKLPCYDAVPDNAPSPFYNAQIVGKRQENTKNMYCEVFTVWIHAIAESSNSSVPIYELIERLEEALSEEINLPSYVELIRQSELGLQSLQTDETNEKHAVIAYEIKVCYGFMAKI